MKYGVFDDKKKEYKIEQVNTPVPWKNYIGVKDKYGVFDQTAGGYLLHKIPNYYGISDFTPNDLPRDFSGQYVYLRDEDTGEFWTISWQPSNQSLEEFQYTCRHGLSYSVYECQHGDLFASQKISVAMDHPVEILDIFVRNAGAKTRNLSLFTYVEWSGFFPESHNFQVSRFEDGMICHDYYGEKGVSQYFLSSFEPDGYDCLQKSFCGTYGSLSAPEVVKTGDTKNSYGQGGAQCAVLRKKFTLEEDQEVRLFCLLGEGDIQQARTMGELYGNVQAVNHEAMKLELFWENKLKIFQVDTPDNGVNSMINIWNVYQSELNARYSPFISLKEEGGRSGLGFGEMAQNAMNLVSTEPELCRISIIQLMERLTSYGYGQHLTYPTEKDGSFVDRLLQQGVEESCSCEALWLVPAVCQYVKETGDFELLNRVIPYCNQGEALFTIV